MTTGTDQFLKLQFRRGTSETLKNAAFYGDEAQFQQVMTIQHRTARKRLAKAIASGESSILWSDSQLRVSAADRELTSLLAGRKKRHRAARKLTLESLVLGDSRPLLVLTGLDTLVRHGTELSNSDYVALYTALSQIDEITPDWDTADEPQQFIRRLICEGELPLLLSLVLGDLKGRTSRFKTAAGVLRAGLEAGTDTDGMLHATLNSRAEMWLAPFVRSAHWGSAFGKSWLTPRQTHRLADAVRSCVTLLTRTGLVGSPPVDLRNGDRCAAEVFEHGIRAVGIRESSPFTALLRSDSYGRRTTAKEKKRLQQLSTSSQSDWAESAILRSGLQLNSDLCVVNWDQPEASIYLAVLGIPLIAGSWLSEVTVNGESIGPIEGWTCSCWFCDDEAAFVEIETDPSASIHAVRHVLLSLQDHTCIVCESVTTDDADAEVRLENRLALAARPLAQTNSITREIVLHADSVATRVVPAWLEDDRVLHAIGRCEKVGDTLVSEARGHGGALAPYVLDWHPDRQALDADWNRLTVTQARAVLSPHDAAGFRVRIGNLQLVIYRSLRSGRVPRAVMGLHTLNETVYGHVTKSGEIAPLVLVEGE